MAKRDPTQRLVFRLTEETTARLEALATETKQPAYAIGRVILDYALDHKCVPDWLGVVMERTEADSAPTP